MNISATLSIRQQMRMASMQYVGLFDTASVHLPAKVTRKQDARPGNEFFDKLSEFMGPNDVICEDLVLNSQKFKAGDLVLVGVYDRDEVTVGIVQTLLVRMEEVFFVIRKFKALRNDLNYFVSESSDDSISFLKAQNLADHKPLIRYGTDLKFKFYLHHNVSFSYD